MYLFHDWKISVIQSDVKDTHMEFTTNFFHFHFSFKIWETSCTRRLFLCFYFSKKGSHLAVKFRGNGTRTTLKQHIKLDFGKQSKWLIASDSWCFIGKTSLKNCITLCLARLRGTSVSLARWLLDWVQLGLELAIATAPKSCRYNLM